jgi:transcriptional regulator with XRE-family HTH domain
MGGGLFAGGQHPGRGAATADAQLAAGALDQGVGPRLGHAHHRADFLGQPMLADQPQRLALAFRQQLEAMILRGRLVHAVPVTSRQPGWATFRKGLRPARARRIVNLDPASSDKTLMTPSGPDPIDVAVGARIRLLRRQQKVSQDELGQALGLTFQQVQKYERGTNRVSASMLVRIAAKLKTTVAALVGEDGVSEHEAGFMEALSIPGALDLLLAYAKAGPKARKALAALAQALNGPD